MSSKITWATFFSCSYAVFAITVSAVVLPTPDGVRITPISPFPKPLPVMLSITRIPVGIVSLNSFLSALLTPSVNDSESSLSSPMCDIF